MVKNGNKKSLVALGLAALMLLSGTLAYFTDIANIATNGTAGTMDIELTSNINLLDEDGQDILNPGDVRNASFLVTNYGNKSTDVKTIITLKSSETMNTTGQAEYELYEKSKVTTINGIGTLPLTFDNDFKYKSLSGEDAILAYAKDYVVNNVDEDSIVGTVTESEPLEGRTLSEDGKTITYNVSDVILNGCMDLDEYESETGVYSDEHLYDYVLVVNTNTKNNFQNSTISIDVTTLAKQHRNTSAGWALVDNQYEVINPDESSAYSILTASTMEFLTLVVNDENGEEVSEAAVNTPLSISYKTNELYDGTLDDPFNYTMGNLEVVSYNIYNKDTNKLLKTITIDTADDNKTSFKMPKANIIITENTEENEELAQEREDNNIYTFALDTSTHISTTISADKSFDALSNKSQFLNTNSASCGLYTRASWYLSNKGNVICSEDAYLRGYMKANTNVTLTVSPNDSYRTDYFKNHNGYAFFIVDADTGEYIDTINARQCDSDSNSYYINYTMPERNIKVFLNYQDRYMIKDGINYVKVAFNPRYLNYLGSITITPSNPIILDDETINHYTFPLLSESDINLNAYCKEFWVPVNTTFEYKFDREIYSVDQFLQNMHGYTLKSLKDYINADTFPTENCGRNYDSVMKSLQSEINHEYDFYKENYADKYDTFLDYTNIDRLLMSAIMYSGMYSGNDTYNSYTDYGYYFTGLNELEQGYLCTTSNKPDYPCQHEDYPYSMYFTQSTTRTADELIFDVKNISFPSVVTTYPYGTGRSFNNMFSESSNIKAERNKFIDSLITEENLALIYEYINNLD